MTTSCTIHTVLGDFTEADNLHWEFDNLFLSYSLKILGLLCPFWIQPLAIGWKSTPIVLLCCGDTWFHGYDLQLTIWRNLKLVTWKSWKCHLNSPMKSMYQKKISSIVEISNLGLCDWDAFPSSHLVIYSQISGVRILHFELIVCGVSYILLSF